MQEAWARFQKRRVSFSARPDLQAPHGLRSEHLDVGGRAAFCLLRKGVERAVTVTRPRERGSTTSSATPLTFSPQTQQAIHDLMVHYPPTELELSGNSFTAEAAKLKPAKAPSLPTLPPIGQQAAILASRVSQLKISGAVKKQVRREGAVRQVDGADAACRLRGSRSTRPGASSPSLRFARRSRRR